MKTKCLIVSIVAVFITTLCIAGTAWHYQCDTPKCGLAGDLGIGGGFVFEKADGYCTTCKKFVSMSWKHLEKAPDKVGTVWNPATGLTADLYPCPHCKKPFMQIDDLSLNQGRHSAIFCPSCTNLTLKFEQRGKYD